MMDVKFNCWVLLFGFFVILYFGYMFLFVDWIVFNLLLVVIGKDFFVSLVVLGVISFVFFLGYMIM